MKIGTKRTLFIVFLGAGCGLNALCLAGVLPAAALGVSAGLVGLYAFAVSLPPLQAARCPQGCSRAYGELTGGEKALSALTLGLVVLWMGTLAAGFF